MNDKTATQYSESGPKPRFSLKKKVFKTLLDQYRGYKLKRVDLSPENSLSTIRYLLEKARYVFVITQSLDGGKYGANAENIENVHRSKSAKSVNQQNFNARYVQPIVEWQDDLFTIWVGTLASSRKIVEIRHNPNITLAVGNDSAGANLIIHSQATLHTDIEHKLRYWKPEWRLFFPEGPQDEDYIVIRIEPQHLELMDLKHGIVPEPFGLKALQLVQRDRGWQPAI